MVITALALLDITRQRLARPLGAPRGSRRPGPLQAPVASRTWETAAG